MTEQRNTTPETIGVDKIRKAVWNTHRPNEKDVIAFDGLVASIEANGMMHRIVVREVEDGSYEIVDGHRRFAAAKAAGWSEVPCEIVSGLTDEEAQQMTATANLQRLENDPLLEAALVQNLADAGKTYEQIASVIGKDTRYVARRARLCNLTEKWRDWFAEKAPDAADTMEMVAAHEQPLQDTVYDELDIGADEGEIDDDRIGWCFKRHLRDLGEDTAFDMESAGCHDCPFNTANHGLLFPVDDEVKGRCEKAECYVRNWNAATDAKIEALREKKVTVRKAKQKWDVPHYWEACKHLKKTAKFSVPWVYTEDGLKHLVWAEPKAGAVLTGSAMTEEEKAAAKRIKAAHKKWAEFRAAGIAKIRSTLCDGDHAENAQMVVDQGETFRTVMKDYFERMFDGRLPEDLCILVGEIVGFAELGVNADELQALTSPDPAATADDAYLVEADNFNGEEA